jgi:hypothetical protein
MRMAGRSFVRFVRFSRMRAMPHHRFVSFRQPAG